MTSPRQSVRKPTGKPAIRRLDEEAGASDDLAVVDEKVVIGGRGAAAEGHRVNAELAERRREAKFRRDEARRDAKLRREAIRSERRMEWVRFWLAASPLIAVLIAVGVDFFRDRDHAIALVKELWPHVVSLIAGGAAGLALPRGKRGHSSEQPPPPAEPRDK